MILKTLCCRNGIALLGSITKRDRFCMGNTEAESLAKEDRELLLIKNMFGKDVH